MSYFLHRSLLPKPPAPLEASPLQGSPHSPLTDSKGLSVALTFSVAMAEKGKIVEAEVVEETPRLLHAILSIRSFSDIKAILTHEEYDPHVHLMILLTLTFFVGALSFLLGA